VRRVLVLLLALAALAPACSRGDDDGALRIELDGEATVGDRTLGPGTHRLDDGDVVEVSEGSGVVALPGVGTIEVREGSKLEVGDEPVLLDGDALIAGEGVTLSADGTTIALDRGAARVSRATGVAVAVYKGTVEVASGGRSLAGAVPALRQVVVPDAGLLPRRAGPLAYRDEPDPWDRRWLGPAIDLGAELDARSVGLTAAGGDGEGVVAALLGDGGADRVSLRGDGGARSAGEAAVGTAIAATSSGGTLEERLAAAFAFRDQGARWGLVALDRGAERGPLLAALDSALDEGAPVLFASVPASSSSSSGRTPLPSLPSSPSSPSSPGPSSSSPAPAPVPSTPRPTTPPSPTTPPPQVTVPPPVTTPPPTTPPTLPPPITTPPPSVPVPPPTVPPPTIPSTPLDPVLQPVGDIVGGLLGG
jgi:hypothetical protein